MTRSMLAVMAGLLCVLTGLRQAGALRTMEHETRRWTEMLQCLTLHLSEGSLSLPEALRTAADGDGSADRLLRDMADHMAKYPLCTPCEAYMTLASPDSRFSCLQRMFTRLGVGTLESRCLAAEQAGAEMALLAQQAAQRASKDAKLFQTLGMTGGAALTLLLL